MVFVGWGETVNIIEIEKKLNTLVESINKDDFIYSLLEAYDFPSTLVYNTFPFPDISQKQKDTITEIVYNILDKREKHSEKTLAQLYDPNKMPDGLREAHHVLDLAIEKCYRVKPFESDEERLEYLFGLYEIMVGEKV